MGNLIHQWQQPNDLCVKSGPNIEDCSLYRPPSGIAIAATRVSGACEEKSSNKGDSCFHVQSVNFQITTLKKKQGETL